MKAASYEALFGLLAVSGMRIGEAIALEPDDVDLDNGVITIRARAAQARARPSGPLLHPAPPSRPWSATPSTRARLCPRPRSSTFFLSSVGTRLDRSAVAKTLRTVTATLGLRTDTVHPTAHQLRHSFAVRTLIDWQRSGRHVDEQIAVLSTYLGHVSPAETYWYLTATPELMGTAANRLSNDLGGHGHDTAGARRCRRYFVDRLVPVNEAASPNTIAAYRHAFKLLLGFATTQTGKSPSALDIADLDAPLIASFLDHLERERHNTIQTRNNRLAAIHSLFAYLALHHPEHADIDRPRPRDPVGCTERNLLTYLTDPEVEALPNGLRSRPRGRDGATHTMLALTIQTGLRISELINLNCQDITLGTGANVHTIGKGRKDKTNTARPNNQAPYSKHGFTSAPAAPEEPLTTRRPAHDSAATPSSTASRSTCQAGQQPTAHRSNAKHITMHTLRHTAAMRLLLAGNDITVIALWLGHEQISTTNIYLHADMTHKQKAIDRTRPINAKPGRYQPTDTLLAFLEAL